MVMCVAEREAGMLCVTQRITHSKALIPKNSRGGEIKTMREIVGEAVEIPGEAVLCQMISRLLQEEMESEQHDDC